MEEANKANMSLILNMLPPEMLEKVLKRLKLKEICQAQLVCKRWKDIIVKGNLVKKVAGKHGLLQQFRRGTKNCTFL